MNERKVSMSVSMTDETTHKPTLSRLASCLNQLRDTCSDIRQLTSVCSEADTIRAHCECVRHEVTAAKESAVECVTRFAEMLLLEVSVYEQECLSNLLMSRDPAKRAKCLDETMHCEEFVSVQTKCLASLTTALDEAEAERTLDTAERLRRDTEQRRVDIRADLFKNRLVAFRENKASAWTRDLLGELCFSSIKVPFALDFKETRQLDWLAASVTARAAFVSIYSLGDDAERLVGLYEQDQDASSSHSSMPIMCVFSRQGSIVTETSTTTRQEHTDTWCYASECDTFDERAMRLLYHSMLKEARHATLLDTSSSSNSSSSSSDMLVYGADANSPGVVSVYNEDMFPVKSIRLAEPSTSPVLKLFVNAERLFVLDRDSNVTIIRRSDEAFEKTFPVKALTAGAEQRCFLVANYLVFMDVDAGRLLWYNTDGYHVETEVKNLPALSDDWRVFKSDQNLIFYDKSNRKIYLK